MEVALRPMTPADLDLVEEWLATPHVAEWWLHATTLEDEMQDIRDSLAGRQAVELLIVLTDRRPVGWCQWYLCGEDPEWAEEMGAGPHDAGIDYAIGAADLVGRGVGTALIAALVARIRAVHPGCAITADPCAANSASCRVLEKNGFVLTKVQVMASEPDDEPMAVYRLAACPARPA